MSTPAHPTGEVGDIVELRADLEAIQDWDRPLPWVVHSGSSYRRIASLPTRENPRSFPDGNVLHGTIQRSDGHPDLSMGEDQLCALVRLVNALPELLDLIQSLQSRLSISDENVERVARAILEAMNGEPVSDEQWESTRLKPDDRVTLFDWARSVIASLGEVG